MGKIYICLREQRLRLLLNHGRKVELLFAGPSRYFYLLFIALVARKMKDLASVQNDRPFVPFISIAPAAVKLAVELKGQGRTSVEKMASTIYQTWHSRLIPPGKCVYEPDHRLTEEEEVEIESLFEKQKRKAGMAAAYRLGRSVKEIVIRDEDVLDAMLGRGSQSQVITSHSSLYQHVPDKPYYEGLNRHETLLGVAASALDSAESGRLLQLWGMGGIGKSTIAAELARRLTREMSVKAVQWVCAETSFSEGELGPPSLRSQMLDTILIQLGLHDRIEESLQAKLEAIRKCDILPESLQNSPR